MRGLALAAVAAMLPMTLISGNARAADRVREETIGPGASAVEGGVVVLDNVIRGTRPWKRMTFPFVVHEAPDAKGYFFARQFGFAGARHGGHAGLRPRPGGKMAAVFAASGPGVTAVDTKNCKAAAARPDTAKSDATQPDATQPDATRPETTETDATKTDAAQTEVTKTDATESGATKTEVTKSEGTQTETTPTETAQTETAQTDAEADSRPIDTDKVVVPEDGAIKVGLGKHGLVEVHPGVVQITEDGAIKVDLAGLGLVEVDPGKEEVVTAGPVRVDLGGLLRSLRMDPGGADAVRAGLAAADESAGQSADQDGVTCTLEGLELKRGHRYEITVARDDAAAPAAPTERADRAVWRATVRDADEPAAQAREIGAWSVPASHGDLRGRIGGFIAYDEGASRCGRLPYADVTFRAPKVDGGTAIAASSRSHGACADRGGYSSFIIGGDHRLKVGDRKPAERPRWFDARPSALEEREQGRDQNGVGVLLRDIQNWIGVAELLDPDTAVLEDRAGDGGPAE
ncbi:hypothetical protein GCM10009678_61120 [Actinomadura kijaniata]|uniref:Uncharacterized protein n=1 Tax=Actinomadura namibiensis TaxID=182080 RepID=A0A7W3LHS0_ACTNM|nr:hypothetical protein [Actinomadura namibiensis]